MTPRPKRIFLVAALLLANLFVSPDGAVAGDVGQQRAEAAALAAQLDKQADAIVAVDRKHRQAQERLQDAEAGLAQAEAALAGANRQHDDSRRLLVQHAQDAYVLGGSISFLGDISQNNLDDVVVRRTYLRIITGQDRNAIGRLKASREDLEAERSRLEGVRTTVAAEAAAVGGERAALERAIAAQRASLARVNGELARLLAAEQAKQQAVRAAAGRPAPLAAGKPSAAPVVAPSGAPGGVFACIRQLESGNNYGSRGGGAYQFLDSTWQSLGYPGSATNAPPGMQDEAALKLQAQEGWKPWTTAPLCGRP